MASLCASSVRRASVHLHTERFARSDGLAFAYQVLGRTQPGTPVALIQGWTCTMADWGSLALGLSQDRPVLIFDNRGIGETNVPDDPEERGYTIPQLSDDTAQLLSHVGYQKAHIMGVSMGGMIAQHLAVENPGLVSSLVLGCTTHGGKTAVVPDMNIFQAFSNWDENAPLSERRNIAERWLKYLYSDRFRNRSRWADREVPPTRFDAAVDLFLASHRPAKGISAQARALMRFSMAEEIKSLEVPTLVVQGTQDKIIPPGNAGLLVDKIKNANLQPLPGCGHVFWEEAPGISVDAIGEFLAEVDANS